MIDIALCIVILSLVSYIAWERHETRKEQAKLIHAIKSRNAREFAELEFNDKVEPVPPPQLPADYIPAENMDEKEFDDHIQRMRELEDNA